MSVEELRKKLEEVEGDLKKHYISAEYTEVSQGEKDD